MNLPSTNMLILTDFFKFKFRRILIIVNFFYILEHVFRRDIKLNGSPEKLAMAIHEQEMDFHVLSLEPVPCL